MENQEDKKRQFFFTATLPARRGAAQVKLCVNARELEHAGVPARKTGQVYAELQNQVNADPALNRRPLLFKLARRIARLLP